MADGAPKSWRTIDITQQVSRGYTKEYVQKQLAEWGVVKDYAYILHDKDLHTNGTPVEPHVHCMIRFNSAVPTTAILKRLQGVCEIGQLEKCKAWNSCLAYLTHKNAPEKYQYPDSDVVSNFDWQTLAAKAIKFDLSPVLLGIESGAIKRYNIVDYIGIEDYTKCKRQLDTAFEYRNRKIRSLDREMKCIFISGKAGCGKTSNAKKIARSFGYECYVSSGGKNPLDNYEGQECIILDDCRPSTFALADFLKLTDPHTDSLVGCRYYNKSISECKLMIVTSVLDIDDFYEKIQENEKEPKIQLYRRFEQRFIMDYKTVKAYTFDDNKLNYVYCGSVPNIIGMQKQKDIESLKSRLKCALTAIGGDELTVQSIADAVDSVPDSLLLESFDDDSDCPF